MTGRARMRRRLRVVSATVILGFFSGIGGLASGRWVADQFLDSRYAEWAEDAVESTIVPVSVLPGPERQQHRTDYRLHAANSVRMRGEDHPFDERWLDMAGNAYSREFVSGYSYESGGPEVRLRIERENETFSGRIEAQGLKPNFVYQLKLTGVFRHREAFETIGSVGRWRLPGRGTNYTDSDYRRAGNKHLAEAYILFDFLITDRQGNATRDFALDHSLHVLWNASRQRDDARPADVVPVWVDASDPDLYVRPKSMPTLEKLWAEREMARYTNRPGPIQLPPGRYRAELALTEESFHDAGNDGGWWATVMRVPVSFRVTGARRDDG